MRPIDADALIQRLNEVKTGGERMGQKGIARVDLLFRLFELMTKNAPTVDAFPEREAEWIEIKGGMKYECSECNGKVFYKTKYCPNCGAEMEKEIENEKSNS